MTVSAKTLSYTGENTVG